jgi:hypothetical protein
MRKASYQTHYAKGDRVLDKFGHPGTIRGKAKAGGYYVDLDGTSYSMLIPAANLRPAAKANPRYASGAYAERIKLPGWNRPANLVEASAPRVRASFPGVSHEAAIEKAIVHANAAARAYNRTMKAAIAKHGDPHPWISGIGSEDFPEATKKLLRKQLDAFNRAQDAVALHYKALGKRTPLHKSDYAHRLVTAGGYGLGGAKSNPGAGIWSKKEIAQETAARGGATRIEVAFGRKSKLSTDAKNAVLLREAQRAAAKGVTTLVYNFLLMSVRLPGGESGARQVAEAFLEASRQGKSKSNPKKSALSPEQVKARLFIGNYPGGMVYADRAVEKHGDYKRVAFLDYGTLDLRVDSPRSPLLDAVRRHAANLQAKKGQYHALSATAARDAAGNLIGDGQTVQLGWRKNPKAKKNPREGVEQRPNGTIYLRYQTRSPRSFTPLSALKGMIPVGSLWRVDAWRANDGVGGYGVWAWDGKTLVAAAGQRPSEVGKAWSTLYPGRKVVTLTPAGV